MGRHTSKQTNEQTKSHILSRLDSPGLKSMVRPHKTIRMHKSKVKCISLFINVRFHAIICMNKLKEKKHFLFINGKHEHRPHNIIVINKLKIKNIFFL